MTKQQQIIAALKALKRATPDFYDTLKEDYCPHNVGLKSARENECGMTDMHKSFVIGFCPECWHIAMEADE